MERLKLKCQPLDDLLGGGIESNTITEIHGEAGSGKTNLCLQATREYASKGKKVAYVDSEGVSLERLEQMCKDYDSKSIFSNRFDYPDRWHWVVQLVMRLCETYWIKSKFSFP